MKKMYEMCCFSIIQHISVIRTRFINTWSIVARVRRDKTEVSPRCRPIKENRIELVSLVSRSRDNEDSLDSRSKCRYDFRFTIKVTDYGADIW